MKPPLERAARALCSLDGHPENATMDGKPLWQDYLPEARAVIAAIRDPDDDFLQRVAPKTDGHNARLLWQHMINALLAGE